MNMIKLGKIVNVRGVHGEIKILPYSNIDNIFSKINRIFISSEEYKISGVKHVKNCSALKLRGIETPEEARIFVGKEVFAEESDLPNLEKDNYYVKDIIGMTAIDSDGNKIGTLTGVFFTGANDVYEITAENGKTALVPAVKEFVKNISLDEKTVIFDLIDGMFPES